MNLSSSYRAKLLNKSRNEGKTFQLLSLLYMQEGFLNRLSKSKYNDKLVLKGGLLLYALNNFKGRSTKDIDFLGRNIPEDNCEVVNIIKEIISIDCKDGLIFDRDSVKAEKIMSNNKYEGNRIKLACYLDSVKNNMQIDIGFGDIIYPNERNLKYPTLLEDKEININTYSIESVIAEKIETIISKAETNSRIKDFYDLYMLFQRDFNKSKIKEAIKLTFNNRKTNIDTNHPFLNEEYWKNPEVIKLWNSFNKRIGNTELNIMKVKDKLWNILNPVLYEYIFKKNIENKVVDKSNDKGMER